MKSMQIHSIVGEDGILNLSVALGSQDASSRVLVTIQPAPAETTTKEREEWHRFVEETYGSCAGMGLERPDQGEFEVRDAIE